MEPREETRSHLHWTIPWNSAKLVKIFPGIIARLHHTDRRLMVLLKEQVRRVKENTSAVLLQSGLNESWWADSMECYTYLRNVTDFLSDGKTPYEGLFGHIPSSPRKESFLGPLKYIDVTRTTSYEFGCQTREAH